MVSVALKVKEFLPGLSLMPVKLNSPVMELATVVKVPPKDISTVALGSVFPLISITSDERVDSFGGDRITGGPGGVRSMVIVIVTSTQNLILLP